MWPPSEVIGLNAFAMRFGDYERRSESIEGHAAICSAKGLPLSLDTMGCGTFWQMTRRVESYIAECVSDTISAGTVAASAVGHIIFSTMDKNLKHLDQNFARTILSELGLVNCIPTLISMQQCVSSLAAVNFAYQLFANAEINHVIVVAFDFVLDDADRIQPFALFGDAVTSCMVSRGDTDGFALLSYSANMDFAGLSGNDNFESRKRVVVATLEGALKDDGSRMDDVEKFFSTNLYKPIALFNAGACGVHRSRLGIDTLKTRAHCGNCDWMMNLTDYGLQSGFTPGRKYIVQSYAPGFVACGLLKSGANIKTKAK